MTDLMKWIVPMTFAMAVTMLQDSSGWAWQQQSSKLQLVVPESFDDSQEAQRNSALAFYYPLKYEEYLIRSLQKQNRVQQEKIDFLTNEVAAANYRLLAAKIDLFRRNSPSRSSVSSEKIVDEEAIEVKTSSASSEDVAYERSLEPSIELVTRPAIGTKEFMRPPVQYERCNEISAASLAEGEIENRSEARTEGKAAAAGPLESKKFKSDQMVEQVSRALALVDEAEAKQRELRRVVHEQNAIFEVMEKRLVARKAIVEQKLRAAKSHKPAGESMPHVAASSISEGGKSKRDSVIAYIQEELNVLTALQEDLEGLRGGLHALEL